MLAGSRCAGAASGGRRLDHVGASDFPVGGVDFSAEAESLVSRESY